MYKAAKLPFPPHWVNAYMWDKAKDYSDVGADASATFVPFVFATATNYEEIWNYLGEGPLLVNCERMLRYRTSPFYPVKKEQLVWYVRTTSPESMMNFINLVISLLDREDVAAQELNSWARDKQAGEDPILLDPNDPTQGNMPHNVFFHKVRVFLIDESRDITELGSSKNYTENKIIIEYDYHVIQDTGADIDPATAVDYR